MELDATALFDPDFSKKVMSGAKSFIANAKEDEDRKNIIPKMTWRQFSNWLNDALQVNPNIQVTIR